MLIKSINFALDINSDIAELEHNKIYKYNGIIEVCGINHTINKKIWENNSLQF